MCDEHITISAPAHGLLPPTDTNRVWPFLSYGSSSSPPLLIFTESRLPSLLPHWHPLSHLYSLLHVHFKHSHLQTHYLLCLTPSIIYLTLALKHTHARTHTRVHTLVCVLLLSDFPMRRFWGLVLERLVFLSENFKLSNCRKQKKKKQQLQTRKSKQWVSERRALLCFFIYVLLSLTWWS